MDIAKFQMQKKFDVLEDVELNTNLLILQEITTKWYKSRPDNKDLQMLRDAMLKVSLIANKLKYEKSLYHTTISEYRQDKIRAIERARRVEEELKQINKKVKL
tara:strand:+ start:2516 stop:2824 length:309 start_codon:yes stop_codon:yes gene_type:complete